MTSRWDLAKQTDCLLFEVVLKHNLDPSSSLMRIAKSPEKTETQSLKGVLFE